MEATSSMYHLARMLFTLKSSGATATEVLVQAEAPQPQQQPPQQTLPQPQQQALQQAEVPQAVVPQPQQQTLQAVTSLVRDLRGNPDASEDDEKPPCDFCADSGWYGFSVCSHCDGVPKPVKKKRLPAELVITRQTSSHFLMHDCSAKQSEDPLQTREEEECKICLSDVADVVMRPCGHGALCEDCTRRLVGEKSTAFCPYCRTPISAFMKVDPRREVSVVREEFQVRVSEWRR